MRRGFYIADSMDFGQSVFPLQKEATAVFHFFLVPFSGICSDRIAYH